MDIQEGPGPSEGGPGEASRGQAKTKRVVERAYGSGESSYFYQLERFAQDVEAASGSLESR